MGGTDPTFDLSSQLMLTGGLSANDLNELLSCVRIVNIHYLQQLFVGCLSFTKRLSSTNVPVILQQQHLMSTVTTSSSVSSSHHQNNVIVKVRSAVTMTTAPSTRIIMRMSQLSQTISCD